MLSVWTRPVAVWDLQQLYELRRSRIKFHRELYESNFQFSPDESGKTALEDWTKLRKSSNLCATFMQISLQFEHESINAEINRNFKRRNWISTSTFVAFLWRKLQELCSSKESWFIAVISANGFFKTAIYSSPLFSSDTAIGRRWLRISILRQ